MSEIDYKKKCEEYERKLGVGEFDPSLDGYIVLVNILRQQNDYLRNINIGTMISNEDKAKTEEYKRAKDLWENLPTMIKGVNGLKVDLKIEPETKKVLTKQMITSEGIADVLTDRTGQEP